MSICLFPEQSLLKVKIVTFVVVLSSLVVEPMGNFVPNDPTYAAIVEILWALLAEENALDMDKKALKDQILGYVVQYILI
jgi:hypothetical protein